MTVYVENNSIGKLVELIRINMQKSIAFYTATKANKNLKVKK